jgi:hypothetical protein
LACERPEVFGRSLSQWDCAELARQRIADGLVPDISAATIRRILATHQLKSWRHHLWLYPRHPRDAEFYATVAAVIDLYTRLLRDDEIVLSLDEKTSLQPRPRLALTRPAQPPNRPNRYEHEYKRAGALNLFAAFETRAGKSRRWRSASATRSCSQMASRRRCCWHSRSSTRSERSAERR